MWISIVTAMLVALAAMAAQSPFSNAEASQEQITFTRQVARILQGRCQICHRSGAFAPMSLVTYEETRPWAKEIKQKVINREMPPWFIDKNVGVQHFSNDVSLSDQEIATIAKWVDNGAPKGNPADMPTPRQFQDVETWHIGKPDLIVALPKDIIVPAKAPDQWPDILVDPGLTNDRYIQGVQIIPTKGFPVIHHIRTSIVEPTDETRNGGRLDSSDAPLAVGEQGVFLNEYAIGKKGDVFPEGSGRLIKAGTKINFQMHLHANGTDTPANVALGLKFYPKGYVPRHVISSTTVSAPQVDIRPHSDNVRSDGYLTLKQAARLLSFQPHMHNRGKAECLEAIYPTGTVEMLSCAKFRFNWHLNYVYDDLAAPLLPAGTVLHSIMWHDNTAANPFNPDPDAQITYGQRTIDEMGSAWISWYYMSDDDFKRETAARRTNRATLTDGVRSPIASAPVRQARGQDVSPTFDGWEQNPDGTYSMYFGYFNRNTAEELFVPIGPDNTIEPGGDRGQPTHFYPERKWWVFKIIVPKDWPKQQRVVWTLTTHGKTNQAKGWLQPEWEVDKGVIAANATRDPFLMSNARGETDKDLENTAPVITATHAQTVRVSEVVRLTAMATDDGRPKPLRDGAAGQQGVRMRWILYRGPGSVRFENDIMSQRVHGKPATLETKATFSVPGTYRLRAIANDGQLFSTHDVEITVQP